MKDPVSASSPGKADRYLPLPTVDVAELLNRRFSVRKTAVTPVNSVAIPEF